MKKMLKQYFKKGISFVLAVFTVFALAACGNSSETGSAGRKDKQNTGDENDYTYVPEFFVLDQEENGGISTAKLTKNGVYYTVYKYDPETGEGRVELTFRSYENLGTAEVLELANNDQDGYSRDMNTFFFDDQENLYVFSRSYPIYVQGEEYDYSEMVTYLTKYDTKRQVVWEVQIDNVYKDEENSYIQTAVVSSNGMICGASNAVIYVFDAGTGEYSETINVDTDWINDMVTTSDGRVFVTQYGDQGLELLEVDISAGKLGQTYTGLPDTNGTIKAGTFRIQCFGDLPV